MYIWLAADADEQLAALRGEAVRLTTQLGAENTALTLPLHVSLRISFPIGEDLAAQALQAVRAYFQTLPVFCVEPAGVEHTGGLVWLRMKDSPVLQSIHEALVTMLQTRFAVAPHAFDLAYCFHATLWTEACTAELAFRVLREIPFPGRFAADTLLIGVSETGRAGDFRVLERICLTGG